MKSEYFIYSFKFHILAMLGNFKKSDKHTCQLLVANVSIAIRELLLPEIREFY